MSPRVKSRWWRLLACMILGILVGASFMNSHLGRTIDQLTLENQQLSEEITANRSELEEIKKSLANQRRQVITSVETHVSLPKTELNQYSLAPLKLSLEKRIKEILQPFLGKELPQMNPVLLLQVLEGRIIPVEGQSFQLHVKTLIYGEKLIYYLEATPVQTGA